MIRVNMSAGCFAVKWINTKQPRQPLDNLVSIPRKDNNKTQIYLSLF
jgi:hypothetical protein